MDQQDNVQVLQSPLLYWIDKHGLSLIGFAVCPEGDDEVAFPEHQMFYPKMRHCFPKAPRAGCET